MCQVNCVGRKFNIFKSSLVHRIHYTYSRSHDDGEDYDNDNDDIDNGGDAFDAEEDDDKDDGGGDDDKAGRAAPELLLQFVPTLYCPPTPTSQHQ